MKRYKITIEDKETVTVDNYYAVMVMVGERLEKGILKILIEEVKDEEIITRKYSGRFSPW